MDFRRQRILLIICLIFILSFVFTRSSSPKTRRRISRIRHTSLVRHIPDLPPANATLGFGAIAALSRINSTRRAGLMAAANITELNIVVPDQPIWTDHDVELLKAVNGTRISRGSALAWLGHLNILRWFLSTDLDTVLILEDDVDWDIRLRSSQIPKVASSMRHLTAGAANRDASSLITHVKRSAMTDRNLDSNSYWGPKDSWDVIYLGHCGDMFKPKQWNFRVPRTAFKDDTLPDIEDLHPFTRDFLKAINIPTQVRIVHKSMSPLCTFGFALTRQAARRMLYDIAPHESNGGTAAYDVRMLEACRDLGLRCFTSNPELFHHMDLPSEIEGIDKIVKKARLDAARAVEAQEAADRAAAESSSKGNTNPADPNSQSDGQDQQGRASSDQAAQPQSHSEAVQAAVQEGQQAQQSQTGGIGLLQDTSPAPPARGMGLVEDPPAIGLLKFDKRDEQPQREAAPPRAAPESAGPAAAQIGNGNGGQNDQMRDLEPPDSQPRIQRGAHNTEPQDSPPSARDQQPPSRPTQDQQFQSPPSQGQRSQSRSNQDQQFQPPPSQDQQSQSPPNQEQQFQSPPNQGQQSQSPPSQDQQYRSPSQGQQSQTPQNRDQHSSSPPNQDQQSLPLSSLDHQSSSPPNQDQQSLPLSSLDHQSSSPPNQDQQSRPPSNYDQQGQTLTGSGPPPQNDPSPPRAPASNNEPPSPNRPEPPEPVETGDPITGANATNPNGPGDEADKGKAALGYGKDEEGRLQSPLAGRAPNIRCGARSRTFFTHDAKTLEFLREVVGRQGQCLRDMIEEDMARVPVAIDRRESSWPY